MHGTRLYVTESTTTLAQVLKDHDYRTAAYHANPWISSFYGYEKGFETFDDGVGKWSIESHLSKAQTSVKRVIGTSGSLYKFLRQRYTEFRFARYMSKHDSTTLNRKAMSWLRDNSNTFFLWIHYMDVHEPYLPASRFASLLRGYGIVRLNAIAQYSPDRLSPRGVRKLTELYDANLRHIDRQISSLLSRLRQSNILGYYVYDELIHVPLIIAGPGVKAQVITEQVTLLDLAPTILDMLKIEKPKAFLGKSLLPLMNGNKVKGAGSQAISEADTASPRKAATVDKKPRLDAKHRRIALRAGKWKYIYTEGGQDELYCLAEDPGETKNIIDAKPQVAADLRAKIMAHIQFEEKSNRSEEGLIKARIGKLRSTGKI